MCCIFSKLIQVLGSGAENTWKCLPSLSDIDIFIYTHTVLIITTCLPSFISMNAYIEYEKEKITMDKNCNSDFARSYFLYTVQYTNNSNFLYSEGQSYGD
jgi:hypothetical protein